MQGNGKASKPNYHSSSKQANALFQKKISKKQNVNLHFLKLQVLKSGIKSNVAQVGKKYFRALSKYKVSKTLENRKLKNEAKKALRIEKTKENSEIKQIKKLNQNPKGKVHIPIDPQIAIKVNNVTKYYPAKGYITQALKNVNLEFKKGSFNVILGESGSGKTTLLNVISGLDRATSGEVIVDNVNIQSLTDHELTLFRRQKIGFVFQSYNLLSALNVRDNIEIGRSLQDDINKRQNIEDLLKRLKMQDESKKMIYELSGGQQQRVSIARALAKAPSILFGDEPTGALDRETSKKIFRIFKEINKTQKSTIIIVTHNPRIAKFANQVIVISDGQIQEIYKNANPMKVEEL